MKPAVLRIAWAAMPSPGSGIVLGSLGVLAVGWVFAAQAGSERPRRFNYVWHLFYWFLPIIAAQWIIGWGILAPLFHIERHIGVGALIADTADPIRMHRSGVTT